MDSRHDGKNAAASRDFANIHKSRVHRLYYETAAAVGPGHGDKKKPKYSETVVIKEEEAIEKKVIVPAEVDDFLRDVDLCSICTQDKTVPTFPITSCRNGHKICAQHSATTKSCSTCGIHLPPQATNSSTSSSTRQPGPPAILPDLCKYCDLKNMHRSYDCQFRPFDCNVIMQAGFTCVHRLINFQDYLGHLTSEHGVKSINGEPVSPSQEQFEVEFNQQFDYSVATSVFILRTSFGTFILRARFMTDNDNYSDRITALVNLYIHGSEEDGRTCTAKLEQVPQPERERSDDYGFYYDSFWPDMDDSEDSNASSENQNLPEDGGMMTSEETEGNTAVTEDSTTTNQNLLENGTNSEENETNNESNVDSDSDRMSSEEEDIEEEEESDDEDFGHHFLCGGIPTTREMMMKYDNNNDYSSGDSLVVSEDYWNCQEEAMFIVKVTITKRKD